MKKELIRLKRALRKIQTEANFSENEGAFDLGEHLLEIERIASAALNKNKHERIH